MLCEYSNRCVCTTKLILARCMCIILLYYKLFYTIVVCHLKGTAICTNPMYLGRAFQARVHPCTLGYMRVAGQLWSLLKTVKQLAGTTKATMAQVICFCFPFQFSPFPVHIYYCVCYSIGLHSTVAQQKVLNVSLISHLYCPPYCNSVVKYSVNLPVQSCLHLQLADLSGTTLALRSTPTMVSLQ